VGQEEKHGGNQKLENLTTWQLTADFESGRNETEGELVARK
jgi:hypothetical protein